MIYIIDANNLAGKLGLLPVKDSGQELIGIVKGFFLDKRIEVFLVFDSLKYMGDRIRDGNLTIIQSPRDKFYSSADDKIVELVWQFTGVSRDFDIRVTDPDLDPVRNEIVMVSDDLEVIAKVEEIQKKVGLSKLRIERASDFAVRMEARRSGKEFRKNAVEDEDRGLDEDAIGDINNDLLKIWK